MGLNSPQGFFKTALEIEQNVPSVDHRVSGIGREIENVRPKAGRYKPEPGRMPVPKRGNTYANPRKVLQETVY